MRFMSLDGECVRARIGCSVSKRDSRTLDPWFPVDPMIAMICSDGDISGNEEEMQRGLAP